MKDKKTLSIIIATVIVTILVTGTIFISINKKNDNEKLQAESNVITSEKNIKTFDEMQSKTDDSKIGVKINKNIVFDSGTDAGNILLENTSSNKNSFTISLCIEETGEEIYKSNLVEYGTRIDEVKLSKILEKGKYDAIAFLTAYDKNGEKKGTSGLNVSVTVLN